MKLILIPFGLTRHEIFEIVLIEMILPRRGCYATN